MVGATAAGKTALSLLLAQRFNGEIVSADSRLFYRGLDIGTAKPSPAEQISIPHHLIDICDPGDTLSLGQYQRLAYQAIDEILAKGHLPILVGGTGQYVAAVVEGWGIPEVAPQMALRTALEELGEEETFRWLGALDPITSRRIDSRNVRRVIRALEVTLVTGRPISELQYKTPPPYDIRRIGVWRDRHTLYERIDERVDRMMAAGLLDEVRRLDEAGYDRDLPSMSGLGYRQLTAYLAGETLLDEAVARIKFETHRFARQQATWFRRDDPQITWYDLDKSDVSEVVVAEVEAWLRQA